MTPFQLLFFVLLLAFVFACFSIGFFLRKTNRRLSDLFSNKPKIPLNVDEEELNRLCDIIKELPVPERLYLLRTILGNSFKCIIRVSGSKLEIEQAGAELEEETELYDYTG